MRTARAFSALAVAALLPLIAPAAWLRSGAFPDVAVLVVAYVALEAGAVPATWCGVAAGLLMSPWTAEPLGQGPFLLGLLGFLVGTVRQSLYRNLVSVQIGLVAGGALAVRLSGAALAGGVELTLHSVPGALLAAAATAIAAPPVFGLLGRLRLLRPRRRVVRRV